MTNPDAAGQRFLLSNGPALAMEEIAATLKTALGASAARVPTRSTHDVSAPDLQHAKGTSNDKARRVLGRTSRDSHDAIISAAKSMLNNGQVVSASVPLDHLRAR